MVVRTMMKNKELGTNKKEYYEESILLRYNSFVGIHWMCEQRRTGRGGI